MKLKRGFASDNNSGIHPKVLEAIANANAGHVLAYGDDPYTESATRKVQSLFRGKSFVQFVFNGTAANVLALSALTEPFHAILCAETAHIQVDECGAPERFTGSKLVTSPTIEGKLNPALLDRIYKGVGDQHHVQPRVVAISQSTEMGTVYSPAEIRLIADWAHKRKMFLFVDGARIANAVASQGCSIAEMLEASGVDAFSFGGTKNGSMAAEAVVFFRAELAENFKYRRKQGMQLASKMRFLACQFEAFLTDDLWLKNAAHANRMAKFLEAEARKLPGVAISLPVQANGVFASVPGNVIASLQEKSFFYVWDEEASVVRWMAAWDTTEEDVMAFVGEARRLLG